MPFISLLKDAGKVLKCLEYHGGDTINGAQREKAFKDWISGTTFKSRWMICTGAFAAGNDYSHVRVVIHASTPLDFMECCQSQGRGGRDCKHAIAYILPSAEERYMTITGKTAVHKSQELLKKMVYSKQEWQTCVREIIGNYCDGQGLKCQDPGPPKLVPES